MLWLNLIRLTSKVRIIYINSISYRLEGVVGFVSKVGGDSMLDTPISFICKVVLGGENSESY